MTTYEERRAAEQAKELKDAAAYDQEVEAIADALIAYSLVLLPCYADISEANEHEKRYNHNRTLYDLDYSRNKTGLNFRREKNNRLSVGGDIENFRGMSTAYYTDRKPDRITVSRDRTPESIAADIMRRLWPAFDDYRDYWHDLADAAANRRDGRTEARQRLINRFSAYDSGGENGKIYGRKWETRLSYEGTEFLKFTDELPEGLYMSMIHLAETYEKAQAVDQEHTPAVNFIWELLSGVNQTIQAVEKEVEALAGEDITQ